MNQTTLHRNIMLTAIVLASLFAGVLVFALLPTPTPQLAPGAESGAQLQALIARGRYVAQAGDCVACHTARGGKPFAGGLPLWAFIGNVYTSNITPDRETGIGSYSLDDFDRAVRYGIKPDGNTMYPAMPFPSYSRMSEDDLRALYAYFMHEVVPVKAENRDSDIRWPMSLRWPLAIWRKFYVPTRAVIPFDGSRYPDQRIARGAYLVQSLGHCGSCHTPRARFTLQELALDDGNPLYLSGGPEIDGWVAVNLRGNQGAGLGNWSQQQIVDVLKSGRNLHTAIVGQPMADVVEHSMQLLNEADLQAIAAYLKTLAPAPGVIAQFKPNPDTAALLHAGQDSSRGAQLYLDNCAACHRSNGMGADNVFPAIAGNPTVLAANPDSLIRLVLGGSALPSTKVAPSNLGMPGFGWRLSDDETAQLVTFVRQSWGNMSGGATVEQVAAVRKAMDEAAQKD